MSLVSEHDEVRETVVYTVQIQSANKGAWYRSEINTAYDCILEVVDKSFGGKEIMFRVMNAFHPVKYIKQQHCRVIEQHFGKQNELIQFYGYNK